jgi:hypothetical protein
MRRLIKRSRISILSLLFLPFTFIYVYNLVFWYLFMFTILFTCIYLCLQSCLLTFCDLAINTSSKFWHVFISRIKLSESLMYFAWKIRARYFSTFSNFRLLSKAQAVKFENLTISVEKYHNPLVTELKENLSVFILFYFDSYI